MKGRVVRQIRRGALACVLALSNAAASDLRGQVPDRVQLPPDLQLQRTRAFEAACAAAFDTASTVRPNQVRRRALYRMARCGGSGRSYLLSLLQPRWQDRQNSAAFEEAVQSAAQMQDRGVLDMAISSAVNRSLSSVARIQALRLIHLEIAPGDGDAGLESFYPNGQVTSIVTVGSVAGEPFPPGTDRAVYTAMINIAYDKTENDTVRFAANKVAGAAFVRFACREEDRPVTLRTCSERVAEELRRRGKLPQQTDGR